MKIVRKIKAKYKEVGLIKLIYLIFRYPFERINYFLKRLRWMLLTRKDASVVFNTIYKKNLWSSSESVSGDGSEKAYTKNLRDWLVDNIPKYKITTIVDSPCGDFNWMRYVMPHVSVKYLGLDIVEELIYENKLKHSSEDISFKKLNIISEPIPNCDLLIVRDCLFHFSYEDIDKFLKNIQKTDFNYLLITTHIVDSEFKNTDIRTGDFRIINLLAHPFNFKENHIIELVKDYPDGHSNPKNMILIKKEFVPNFISL